MEELLVNILNQYMAQLPPYIITILVVMASLRVVFKPLCSLAQLIVKQTPGTKDDVRLDKVLGSKAYKTVAYILDLVASLKLPKKKE